VRTYLLHGTPGSGKSSLVHCLASEMGYGVATLTFAPGMADSDIAAALSRMPPRCFLVVEDIDCAFAGRAAKNHGVAFGTILTALDGGMTEAPLAVFMTTNHLAELDPALRRRIDHVQEFKAATQVQGRALFDAFFPGGSADEFQAVWAVARGSAMSVLQKYLVKARQAQGGVLARLDMLQSLVDCCDAPAAGGGARPDMYG
jgi:chaperone BCS1